MARDEAAEILRGLIERITVRADARGHLIELTGDIVKLFPWRSVWWLRLGIDIERIKPGRPNLDLSERSATMI